MTNTIGKSINKIHERIDKMKINCHGCVTFVDSECKADVFNDHGRCPCTNCLVKVSCCINGDDDACDEFRIYLGEQVYGG